MNASEPSSDLPWNGFRPDLGGRLVEVGIRNRHGFAESRATYFHVIDVVEKTTSW